MSATVDLSNIGRGFSAPVIESQAVFRRALHALSRPGEIVQIECSAELPPCFQPAAGALLLVLLDQDTRVWLAPPLDDQGARYLRFHTGCVLVEQQADADVAVVGAVRHLPPLASFALGAAEYPERSATVVVQVETLNAGAGWSLQGPGIEQGASLAAGGLDELFVREWRALQRLFPRGIDLFFACGARLAGLPRTTRIEA
jgi:alpha-D-ribose 1-methylphosphonate 5-triphosphate synthase subunit PhnH